MTIVPFIATVSIIAIITVIYLLFISVIIVLPNVRTLIIVTIITIMYGSFFLLARRISRHCLSWLRSGCNEQGCWGLGFRVQGLGFRV